MRRICSAALIFSLLFTIVFCTLQVAAEELEFTDGLDETVFESSMDGTFDNEDKVEDILSFSCIYDGEKNKINITGTMKHDAFATHRDSTLAIYLIPPGMSEYDVINDPTSTPITETGISVNFGFTFNVDKLSQRFSKYAVFLRSPNGEMLLGTDAQYAEVKTTFTHSSSKMYFKGIAGGASSLAAKIDAGTVIVPVYLDSLITDKSNGYIYNGIDGQMFFDKAYVDELDSKINSATISGAMVYFQFLYRGSAEDAAQGIQYIMPNLYYDNELAKLYSITDFIVKRYNGENAGMLHGIIIGKDLDCYGAFNYAGSIDFNSYSEMCGFYISAVANAARGINSELDIVLPFSGYGFGSEEVEERIGAYSPKQLIDRLLQYFDESFTSGFSCSFLIESFQTPFGITSENLNGGINLDFEGEAGYLYIGKHQAISEYFHSRANYKSVPKSIMMQWTPADDLSGKALEAAYAYSYYCLLNDPYVSSFIIAQTESNHTDEILYMMKHIDTANTFEATKHLLEYFGVSAWQDIVGIAAISNENVKLVYTVQPKNTLPYGYKGSFAYFDFSETLLADRWYRGIGCNSIKLDYAHSEKKALKAAMAGRLSNVNELIYDYEYHENMAYTPYLKFDFEIEDQVGAKNNESSLYEVNIICENPSVRFEASSFVKSNQKTELVLDMSEYTSFGNVESIRISIRTLDGEEREFTLWLYGISGYSMDYTSEELEGLILKDRDMMNTGDNDSEMLPWKRIFLIVFISVIASAVGVGTLIAVRRAQHNDNE